MRQDGEFDALMHFNCMPRLTGVASSHPGPCPHPLPHPQACPIAVPIWGSGITRHSRHFWKPWQKLVLGWEESRGKHLALGQGDTGKGKHREQPARVGGLEQAGLAAAVSHPAAPSSGHLQ